MANYPTGATPAETEGAFSENELSGLVNWAQGSSATFLYGSKDVGGATPFGPETFNYNPGATPVATLQTQPYDNDLSNSQQFLTNQANKF